MIFVTVNSQHTNTRYFLIKLLRGLDRRYELTNDQSDDLHFRNENTYHNWDNQCIWNVLLRCVSNCSNHSEIHDFQTCYGDGHLCFDLKLTLRWRRWFFYFQKYFITLVDHPPTRSSSHRRIVHRFLQKNLIANLKSKQCQKIVISILLYFTFRWIGWVMRIIICSQW